MKKISKILLVAILVFNVYLIRDAFQSSKDLKLVLSLFSFLIFAFLAYKAFTKKSAE
jgi:hypothetical protein